MGDTTEVDVLIIGAGKKKIVPALLKLFHNMHIKLGISGIFASKRWLDLHPHARLVILDRDNCVGGTWNSRKLLMLTFSLISDNCI